VFKLTLILHLLGASIWVGGHLVLSLAFLPRALRERRPDIVQGFESRYERIGIPALITQVVTGVALALHYEPDVSRWFSADNHITISLSAKLLLLATTLALAVHARLRLVPRLGPDTLRPLAFHIVAVTVLGVALLVIGAGIRLGWAL